ncbi:polysaccharide deacetylase family protein [Desulfuromonas carbonis]|uniref:polysaccharide deacetylase family protein n=1 Tax=Desulfuromonas sp. DDH964 TaxID=1823759 RepID=UPI00078BC81A|nr:polysaccharide deacetylase family protein [Desulfuromonas sp. DDH964]AMV72165.1 polysaccharide deacetylase domain-containing protein [Desulfuromonas sp. DDH964]
MRVLTLLPFLLFLIASILMSAPALSLPAPSNEAVVFIYHRFGDVRHPSTNIDLEVFAAQLAWLKAEKRPVLALGEIVRRLDAGEPLPQGCVALTVDDAYTSFLTGGMPLLRRFGFPVTLFVNTDAVGAADYLSWDELRGLAAEGVEIGNHSASHAYLLETRPGEDHATWRSRVAADIERAQQALIRELRLTPRLFAYPFGEYSPALQDLVRELGFAAATSQQSGVVWTGSERFALPRFPMGGAYATLAEFRGKAGMRALPVTVLAPGTPLVSGSENPPRLRVRIDAPNADLGGLRCFVQGENRCQVIAVEGAPGEFLVTAAGPLGGRRNKYTLTAPGKAGGWYWFSQPWFQPRQGADGG